MNCKRYFIIVLFFLSINFAALWAARKLPNPNEHTVVLVLTGTITGAVQKVADQLHRDHPSPNGNQYQLVTAIKFLHLTHTIPRLRRWIPLWKIRPGEVRAQTPPLFIYGIGGQGLKNVGYMDSTFSENILKYSFRTPAFVLEAVDSDGNQFDIPLSNSQGKALEQIGNHLHDNNQPVECLATNKQMVAAVAFFALYNEKDKKIVSDLAPVAEITAEQLCAMKHLSSGRSLTINFNVAEEALQELAQKHKSPIKPEPRKSFWTRKTNNKVQNKVTA